MRLSWLPFALLLVILPYPGTVAARLLLLLISFFVAATWHFRAEPAMRAVLPCKPALVLWWVVSFASLSYAVDPAYSLGELKNELGYALLALSAFFVVGQRRDTALFALRALAGGVAILCGWATATWIGEGFGWNRMGGHGDIGIVATYVVTVLPPLFWIVADDPAPAWRRAGWGLVALAMFIAAITEQRAAWLAIGVETAMIVALLARAGRIPLSRRQVVLAGGVLLAAASGAVLSYSYFRQGNVVALGTDTRMAFWPTVLATIAAHPLAGAGFGRQSMKIAYPHLIPGFNPELWHAHNVFLNYGLALGVPGMIALFALFAAWGRLFWRYAGTAAGIAGCALVAGVVVRNQFNDFFMRDMSLLFWALCGLFAGMCLARREVS